MANKKLSVLIITGGSSSERKISLLSAREVKKALEVNSYTVKLFDFKKGYTQLKKIIPEFDVIFPVMHGEQGEDGILYRFLKSLNKPFIGSDPEGAKIAFDKILFKKYCSNINIPTPKWKIIKKTSDIISFGFPSVLKAANGGSSKEVVLLNSEKDLKTAQVKKILILKDKFYVEEMIKGIEITVGILNEKALPVVEIIPPENGWFDYKNKYSGKSKEIPFAPSVNKKIQGLVQEISLKIHKSLKLGSFSRSDFIVRSNIPYILEVNTPGGVGLTSRSLFPKAARAEGISFPRLVDTLVKLALA